MKEQAIGPHAAGLYGDDHIRGLHARPVDTEAVGVVGGNGRYPRADHVFGGHVLPVGHDAGLGRAVCIQQHPPLLRQGSLENVTTGIMPAGKVASHRVLLQVTGTSSGLTPTGMNSRMRISRLCQRWASSRNPKAPIWSSPGPRSRIRKSLASASCA